MNDGTASVREVLNAIANLDTLSSILLGKGKTYDAILNEVLAHKDSMERWPTMKEFEKKLNLKPGGARKLIDHVYKDLMDLVCDYDNPKYIINNVVHHIYIKYWERSFNIVCKLPVTPSLGDWVDFPFLNAAVGSSYFHVSRVHHEFDGDTQTITLWLENGEYNVYKRFSEDKQEYEREEHRRKQIRNGNI
ncbi:MAG: hypothetical protein Q8M08_02970 [Bacteroidales bacterium]|nr:hypothetical protein [Bacteroidales bacterium]